MRFAFAPYPEYAYRGLATGQNLDNGDGRCDLVPMETLPAVTVFDPIDQSAEARAVAEARGQAASGDTIPLADMLRWLDSWGTPDELPPPPWK